MTALEFTEGATLSSSDFVEVRIKEVKKNCLAGIDLCFAAISVFWILVRVFVNTRSPVSRHNSICKCCSDLITVIFQEPKTLCFLGICQVFYSDQCFLEFGECFREYFKYLDAVLFVKVAHSLLQYISTK